MKYRVINPNSVSVSKEMFIAAVKDGMIDLPDGIAWELLQAGVIAPLEQEKEDGRLHNPGGSQTSIGQQRKCR